MGVLKYVLIFIVFFIIIYILYYLFVTNGQIKSVRGKTKKKKELSTELSLLKNYYNINIEKIGIIKVAKIVNFVNALLITSLAMAVFGISQIWLKVLILLVVIVPAIWATYYFLAKYLKHLERKIDNV